VIILKNGTIRCEEKGTDLYGLVDKTHDTLKVKVEKYKDKLTDHIHDKEAVIEQYEEDSDDRYSTILIHESVSGYAPKIAKRKAYSDNRPLHPAEAIEQMEMLGHTSFLFKNIETNKYAMVYKRDDGDYGLIEPENV
jgi:putative sigma-54 modulation protein